jgi:carbon-monoxide dehydrogenase medium subunit
MVTRRAATGLIGHIPSPGLIADIAANAARDEIEPTGDIHATAEYKRHLSLVLGQRAIQRAVSRAREGWEL